MNNDINKSSDSEEVVDSGFNSQEERFKSQTTDMVETHTVSDFNDGLITDNRCEKVLPVDSESLSADIKSMSSLEDKQTDKTFKSATKFNSMTICNESLSSVETKPFSEYSETMSSDKENFLSKEESPKVLNISPSEKLLNSQEINSELLNGFSKTKLQKSLNSLNKQEKYMKLKDIMSALERNDITMLKKAALTPGGLLNDDIRRKVWPKLVGVDMVASAPRPCQEEIEKHPYYEQVVLDVNRSIKRFPPSIEETQRLTMLDQLVTLIMRVLCKHPELHYYQGYHDICVTFLLVLGEETAYHVVEKLSYTHLCLFMEKSMEPTIHLLEYMYLLIGKRCPPYTDFLNKSEVGVAYCISWLITWFSHVLNDYSTVVRFFDFFIVSHYWMPMYVTASLVLYREPDVIKQDCDMASVHSFLCRIPDDMPFEKLLDESIQLFESYKPKALSKEKPYVKMERHKRVKKWKIMPRIKYIPATLIIAAAVLVSAVIYQAYNV